MALKGALQDELFRHDEVVGRSIRNCDEISRYLRM
jgi:hypothetical protein